MSIEVIETISRQCCEPQDLKPHKGKGLQPNQTDLSYCIHCSQLWAKTWHRFDGAEWYTDWEKVVS